MITGFSHLAAFFASVHCEPASAGSLHPGARTEITALNDQHTLRWEGEAPIALGEVVTLGFSHFCTAFDKWRLIPVVDANEGTEAVETFF